MSSEKITLYTIFQELNPGDNLPDINPIHSLIIRFDSAELKRFESSDLDIHKLEEAWFFNKSECLQVRRSAPDKWLALRISEVKPIGVNGKIKEHEHAMKTETIHALAGERLDDKPGWYYAEMLPHPRHYPVESNPWRAGLKCVHYFIDPKDEIDGEFKFRHLLRPIECVDFEKEES